MSSHKSQRRILNLYDELIRVCEEGIEFFPEEEIENAAPYLESRTFFKKMKKDVINKKNSILSAFGRDYMLEKLYENNDHV